jgi:hypothetical protein
MAKRILLAALLGGITIFIWGALAHTVLGIGELGVKEMPNEALVIAGLRMAVPDSGLYLFPTAGAMSARSSGERHEDYKVFTEKFEGGAHGFLVFHPSGASMAMGRSLFIEFVLNFLQALLLAWLLSKTTALAGYFPRVIFVTLAGLLAAISVNIQYWNWYQFPGDYTFGYILTALIGFFLAGLVIARICTASSGLKKPA